MLLHVITVQEHNTDKNHKLCRMPVCLILEVGILYRIFFQLLNINWLSTALSVDVKTVPTEKFRGDAN